KLVYAIDKKKPQIPYKPRKFTALINLHIDQPPNNKVAYFQQWTCRLIVAIIRFPKLLALVVVEC
ncbi:hypothetical protein, partial [Bacillus andreraoultii]|uniref:hypothetical protein n=1 Tax=Bacillus andreraoultii TaxID=1499685 RepID=UPI00053B8339